MGPFLFGDSKLIPPWISTPSPATGWPLLKAAIDEHRAERGRFVITGSSSPALLHSVSESLAGRIGVIEMGPFSWEEVTDTVGRDSFLQRLQNPKAKPDELIQGLRARDEIPELPYA